MISLQFSTWNIVLIVFCLFVIYNGANGDKVEAEIQRKFKQGETQSVIVVCEKSPAEFTNILKEISEENQNSSVSRANPIITQLVQKLHESVLKFLRPPIQLVKSHNVRYEVLWPSFEIFIPNATELLISKLIKLQNVVKIRQDRIITRIPPQPPGSQPPPHGNKTWNIGLIDGRCKDIKCLGENVIVGVLDTGARVTHDEIKDNWIGKEYKDFGFLNAVDPQTCEQIDDVGHGTHATSISVGKTVGVAPKSQWFMCRVCNATACPESSIKMCMLWASCPYKCGDTSDSKMTKNCALRPHVINNSWSARPKYGTDEDYYFYYDYIKFWNSLGIISTFSTGNLGTECTTTTFPGGYDIVLDVGAVDINATLGYFSSIGPALSTRPLTSESIAVGTCSVDKCTNQTKTCSLIKPTIVAPGVDINAAWNTSDTAYKNKSGTSMAAPHVAGVIALMICSNPIAKWNYKLAYEILTKTTDKSRIDLLGERQNSESPLKRTNLVCNVMLSNICNTYPNNMYGYGLVNACKAVKFSKNVKPKPFNGYV